jgi:hypothetical protein
LNLHVCQGSHIWELWGVKVLRKGGKVRLGLQFVVFSSKIKLICC